MDWSLTEYRNFHNIIFIWRIHSKIPYIFSLSLSLFQSANLWMFLSLLSFQRPNDTILRTTQLEKSQLDRVCINWIIKHITMYFPFFSPSNKNIKRKKRKLSTFWYVLWLIYELMYFRSWIWKKIFVIKGIVRWSSYLIRCLSYQIQLTLASKILPQLIYWFLL